MWPITRLDSKELASIGKCYEFCLTLSPRRAYIYAEIELHVDRVVHIFMPKDTLTEEANP